MAYKLEFADNVAEDEDNVSSSTDIVILVKHKDFPYLDGMVVDYVKNGLTEGLDFQNPNIKAKCGCGESFQV
jgi:iron-sulfur cluster assembly protein